MVICCALAAVLLQKGRGRGPSAAPGPEVKLGPVGPEVLVGAPVASGVPFTCGWGLLGEQSYVH